MARHADGGYVRTRAVLAGALNLRFALYAVAVLLFGAAAPGVPWFSPTQALSALVRDDNSVAACMQQDAKIVRAGVSVQAISSNPKLALVQVTAPCVCGAQNCPFYVYRVDGSGAKNVLTGFMVDINTVRQASGPPDIVAMAHDSALVQAGMRYAYRNGKYVVADSWRLNTQTNERKPVSAEVKFPPGMSSTRLAGTVSLGWGDVYTFSAAPGQRLVISSADPAAGIDILLLPDEKPPIHVDPKGNGVVLPPAKTYLLTVDPAAAGNGDTVRYSFMLSIR